MITRLQVRNFKSLRELDVQLGPINVLVGANMSGKSNFLDVLAFLKQVFFPQTGIQEGTAYAIAQRGGINEVLWKGGDNKLIIIALELVDEVDPDTKYKYELQLLAGVGDFVTIQHESLKLIRSGKESDLIAREQGFTYLKNADGKGMGNLGSGASALQYPSRDWDGLWFHEAAKNWRFYHLLPPAMKQSGPMSEGQVLGEHGENLSAWLMWLQTRFPEHFARVNEVLHDLFPEVTQVNTTPTTEGRVYLSARERGLKRFINVWQMSDGFLALTALLSLIYAPAELGGPLFCVEEPENYLHPRLLETLVVLLRQVGLQGRDSSGPRTQFVFTTQSPYFLNQFSLDEMLWVDKKGGETKVYRPADKEHLKRLVGDKDRGLGDLMYTGVLGDEE